MVPNPVNSVDSVFNVSPSAHDGDCLGDEGNLGFLVLLSSGKKEFMDPDCLRCRPRRFIAKASRPKRCWVAVDELDGIKHCQLSRSVVIGFVGEHPLVDALTHGDVPAFFVDEVCCRHGPAIEDPTGSGADVVDRARTISEHRTDVSIRRQEQGGARRLVFNTLQELNGNRRQGRRFVTSNWNCVEG